MSALGFKARVDISLLAFFIGNFVDIALRLDCVHICNKVFCYSCETISEDVGYKGYLDALRASFTLSVSVNTASTLR